MENIIQECFYLKKKCSFTITNFAIGNKDCCPFYHLQYEMIQTLLVGEAKYVLWHGYAEL